MSGLEIAAAAFSVAGTAVETMGAYTQAKQAKHIAEANARQASADANIAETRERRSTRRRLAEAEVAASASGFSSESFSSLLADMAAEAEIDALAHRTEGERQRQFYNLQARQAQRQAQSAVLSGVLKTGKTLATAGYDAWEKT